MLRFVDAEYYRVVVSVLNRLQIAINWILDMLYVIDILHCIGNDDNWGIGIII